MPSIKNTHYHQDLYLLIKVKKESEKADLKLNIQKTKIMAFGPITMANRLGNNRNSERLSWVPESLQMVTTAVQLRDTCSLEGKL